MIKNIYAAFTKSEGNEEDDFITVGGIASSNIVDSDGDLITTEAMEKAKEDYMKWGAIREMHQSIAAGLCTKFEILENGDTYIEAKIYDKETIKKIKAGVLKAFSIGGKVVKRLGKTIIEIILIEISAVDRPANPAAVMQFYKADMTKITNEENDMKVEENLVPAIVVEQAVEVPAVAEVVEPTIPAVEVPAEINKGLNDVARLTALIQELAWLQCDMAWEKEYEGDDSTIPSQLKEAIKSLFTILSSSVKEETSEIAEYMDAMESEKEKSEQASILKAGARNSKSDIEKIQQIHDIALSLGAKSPSAIIELSDASADLEKSFKATIETNEELIKSISAEKDILKEEKESLTKRVKELEAMPIQKPVSSIVNSFSISKSEEGGEVKKAFIPVFKGNGQVDEVATLIKKSLFGN